MTNTHRAEIEKHSNNVWLADLAKQVQADLVAARAEIERLKAELQECRDLLRRFTPHCEDMDHSPEGMHDPMEPCPLERRFKEAT